MTTKPTGLRPPRVIVPGTCTCAPEGCYCAPADLGKVMTDATVAKLRADEADALGLTQDARKWRAEQDRLCGIVHAATTPSPRTRADATDYIAPDEKLLSPAPQGARTRATLTPKERSRLLKLVGEQHRGAADRELALFALKAARLDPRYARPPQAPKGPALDSYKTDFLIPLALDTAEPILAVRADAADLPVGVLVDRMLEHRHATKGAVAMGKMRDELKDKDVHYVRARFSSLMEDAVHEGAAGRIRADEQASAEREANAKKYREQYKQPAPDHRRKKRPLGGTVAATRADEKLSYRDQWKQPFVPLARNDARKRR